MAFHRHLNRWAWNDLESQFALNTAFRVESFSVDALILRHNCVKFYTDMRTCCQRQRCSPRSVVSGVINLMPIFVRVRWWGGVIWYIPYEVPRWLYIPKFTRLRVVFRRQHGSCKHAVINQHIRVTHVYVWMKLTARGGFCNIIELTNCIIYLNTKFRRVVKQHICDW